MREPGPIDRKPSTGPTAPSTASDRGVQGGGRRPYRRPSLVAYGRLVDLTLGGSPGIGDSGAGGQFQDPLI